RRAAASTASRSTSSTSNSCGTEMTKTLKSYVYGEWVAGTGERATLVNPTTEEPVAEAGSGGVDFAKALAWARETGGPALRALTFAERGRLLMAMSKAIHA